MGRKALAGRNALSPYFSCVAAGVRWAGPVGATTDADTGTEVLGRAEAVGSEEPEPEVHAAASAVTASTVATSAVREVAALTVIVMGAA
ncbi:hypothetical protein GCM10007298_33170 [Williamsia phyllosphaerae]|uniref:Uncharacterized protein n=1 Tax=Williamsia phyllosphaerae TaxID=885042 RepID=A0ABQ1V2M5_9NOCA|nr:hypothetical protein GCM10007298_33170 [Williamsia phyllosphaerae]